MYVNTLHSQFCAPDAGNSAFQNSARQSCRSAAAILAIEPAIGSQRESLQPEELARDHIGRQLLLQPAAHLLFIQILRLLCRVQIGNQTLIPWAILLQQHRRLPDTGESFQAVLNLAHFDAVTADLDLVVIAAEELKGTVG